MSKDTLFDRRIVARNITFGRISRKELEQYLGGLPDVSDKSVPMFSAAPISREDAYDDEEDEG
jgi:hypothetical protein